MNGDAEGKVYRSMAVECMGVVWSRGFASVSGKLESLHD